MPSFLGTSDLGGDGKTILLAIINLQLGKTYTVNDFNLGAPYTPVDTNILGDTAIDVIPHASTGKYGAHRVFYNRINISDYGVISLLDTTSTVVVQLLAAINAKFGILLTAADIVDSALSVGGSGKTGTLTISAVCPVFYGATTVQTSAASPAPSPTPPPPIYPQTLWESVDW